VVAKPLVAGGVIDAEGRLALPWLAAPLARALAIERSHALLVRAAPGAGALALGLSWAQSRLCESSPPGAPTGLACGRCGSCRLVQAQAHPDLHVVLPEIERRETGWLIADDRPEGEEGKRKPSRQIRIDDVRGLLEWVTKTSARGRGKVVVLHPAEALNAHAASALLKTVEEPPAGTRLVLTCSDFQHVMPTILSRCQHFAMPLPQADEAAAWLAGQGVGDGKSDGKSGEGEGGAAILLAASDGLPLTALAWQQAGVDAERWAALPKALAQGRAGLLSGCSVAQAVEVLGKVCHDAMALAAGGEGRYFAADAMPPRLALPALAQWRQDLLRLAAAAEHPWHEALAIDALVAQARRALSPSAPLRTGQIASGLRP
jgi:DNA polymerase III subunit delta'